MARAAWPGLAASALAGVLVAGLWPASSPSVATPIGVTGSAVTSSSAGAPIGGTSSAVAGSRAVAGTSRDLARPDLSVSSEASASSSPTKSAAHRNSGHAVTATFAGVASTEVIGTRYATIALNARSGPATDAAVVKVLSRGSRIPVTSKNEDGWTSVLLDGQARWVRSRYLATKKPTAAAASGGIASGACASGSAVESGLTPDAIRVHRAICGKFPQITAYGGVRADSLPEHPSGRALDAMTSNSAVGWQIANWVRANANRLGVSQVLYAQRIWTVQRSSEGWRSFADRGSPTANHYDHVHVSVYGNAGTS